MQSIILDQEFCDQNIFTYYQRSKKIQPKILISDFKKKNITRQLGNDNQQKFQFIIIIISNLYEPKIFQSASLPKKNFTNRDNSSRQYKNLKSLSIETPQIEQKKPKLRSFIGILIKNKLIQNSKQKDLSIQSREKNINLKQVINIHYNKQEPQTVRYKDLQLNFYMEEQKLLKQETLNSVILPHVNQYQNKNDNSNKTINSSRLSVQHYQHYYLQNNKNYSRSLNKQIQQKTFNLSGWSDNSQQ